MSVAQDVNTFFVLGGTLRRDAPSYIARPADEELLRLTLAGEYCNVLAARQMGKSSLMVRTVDRLRAHGVRAAIIDLTAIGTDVTVDEWYFGLVTRLARQLRLAVDEQAWWQARPERSPVQRFSDFLREVVLEEVREPIVVFIDEIDSTLRLKFTDDFFAAIRAMYNARASDGAYQRLTFVLLGVARPSDLVKDRTRTPYNVGVNVDLTDFTFEEAGDVFAPVLDATHPGQGADILRWTLAWTGGQPYLTQKLCAEVAASPNSTVTEGDIDQWVERLFLADEARKESNLQAIRDRVLSSRYKASILKVYQRVLAGKRVLDEERSVETNELKLTGLVRATPQGTLAVRNRVYAHVFDAAWAKAHVPVDRSRRIAVAAVVIAVLAAGVALFTTTTQKTVQALVDEFQTNADSEARLKNLAELFKLGESQSAQARGLFFGLSQADRVALFTLPDPKKVANELVIVVEGVYQSAENTREGNALLSAMSGALRQVDAPGAGSLVVEIAFWLRGRGMAEQKEYSGAVGLYQSAIDESESRGHTNAAVLFDRAIAYAALELYAGALTDFQDALAQDPNRQSAIIEQVLRNPRLRTYWAEQSAQYPKLSAVLPTPVPTPTLVAVSQLTGMPAPTDTAAPTGTDTPTPTSTPTPVIRPTATRTNTLVPPTSTLPPSAPSISFNADAQVINSGACTTLRWDVENVISVFLDNQGVPGHGSKDVCPASTQTFILRIVYSGGTIDRSVTIQVIPPTPIPTNTPVPTNTPIPTPVLINGSFEEPPLPDGSWLSVDSIPGWGVLYGPAIEVQHNVAGLAFDGGQLVELDSHASSGIYQDISTVPGAKYVISFVFSARPGTSADDNRLEVGWNGAPVGPVLTADGTNLFDTSWTRYSYTVTATSNTTRLEFHDAGVSNTNGTYIDDVRITLAP